MVSALGRCSFVSQVCHWRCPPFSVGHAAFLFIRLPGLSQVVSAHFRCFYSFVSQVCHCWCPPFSVGYVAFLFICLPGLSLPVSALFRWPCSISIHLPGLSLLVSALVRWACSISIHVSPRPVTGGVRPLPLAMKHFYSFVSQVRHCWCRVAFHFSSFVFQVCDWWCPPLSVGHEAFLFICFPGPLLLLSALFRWPCSISIH